MDLKLRMIVLLVKIGLVTNQTYTRIMVGLLSDLMRGH